MIKSAIIKTPPSLAAKELKLTELPFIDPGYKVELDWYTYKLKYDVSCIVYEIGARFYMWLHTYDPIPERDVIYRTVIIYGEIETTTAIEYELDVNGEENRNVYLCELPKWKSIIVSRTASGKLICYTPENIISRDGLKTLITARKEMECNNIEELFQLHGWGVIDQR